MRIAFMGTPDFAVPTLEALVAAGHDVVAVYTQPPRPAGRRGRALVSSAVQQCAEAFRIEVRSPITLRDPVAQADFVALNLDIAVVAAYGLILPRAILDAPSRGCLNVHASLLPRWRGAAPIQRAIMAGDRETGVGIMQMEVGLDTGPILLEARIPIERQTTGKLTDELAALGASLMAKALASLDELTPVPQSQEGVTYAAKIDKAEARIDWSRSATEIERLVRALNPAPGAWFEVRGERIKILSASTSQRHPDWTDPMAPGTVLISRSDWGDPKLANRFMVMCGEDVLTPHDVQRSGKSPTGNVNMLQGFPIPAGTILE